jgi:hypothetical protein
MGEGACSLAPDPSISGLFHFGILAVFDFKQVDAGLTPPDDVVSFIKGKLAGDAVEAWAASGAVSGVYPGINKMSGLAALILVSWALKSRSPRLKDFWATILICYELEFPALDLHHDKGLRGQTVVVILAHIKNAAHTHVIFGVFYSIPNLGLVRAGFLHSHC